MRIREIITLEGWVNGQGWSYESCYKDESREVTEDELTAMLETNEWGWWEKEAREGEDIKITVRLYDEDENLLKESSTWESALE